MSQARVGAIGPDTVEHATLSNGLTLLVYPNPSSPSVAMAGIHAAGALLEDGEDTGLAGLTAEALNRGTRSRSFLEFATELDEVGASLSFSAGVEYGALFSRALADDLDVVLRLAADGLRHPLFPEDEVARLRDQTLAGIAHVEDSPSALADRRFHELLYGRDNPYGRPEEGYRETVGALTSARLRDFHGRAYGPATLTIAIVGQVEPARVRDAVERCFGDWEHGAEQVTPEVWRETVARCDDAAPVEAADPVREDLTIAGKTQTEFVLGWLGIRRSDDAFYATTIANFILGQLGLGGRIGASVRDDQGLAYHASSHAESGHARHPWVVRAGINPENVERAIESSLREARSLRDRPPTDEELRLTKQAMIGSLPLRLERNDGIADMLLAIERFELGLDYLSRYPDLVGGVTREHVEAAAAAVLDRPGYTLVTAGPELSAPGPN